MKQRRQHRNELIAQTLSLSTLGLLGLLDLLDNRVLQRLRLGERRVAGDDLSIGANNELLEVPLDGLNAHDTGHLFLQPLEDRGGVFAVYVELAKDGESDAVVDLAEGLNLVVGTGVLAVELVAGEAEDGEVFRVALLQLLVELLEAFELGCETALGGGVDDEDDLALQGGEGKGLALLCEVVHVNELFAKARAGSWGASWELWYLLSTGSNS